LIANSISILLFALSSAVFSGCATIGGAKQTIAFDSKPRGFELSVNKKDDGKTNLKTPSATEIKRASKLNIEYASGDFSGSATVPCQIRYGTVLGGNLGIALLSMTAATPAGAGVIFLTAAGIDLVSGNGFECPSLISREVPVPQAVADELQEGCAPVFVLPPKLEQDDIGLSYALMSEAQEFAIRYDKSCREFASPAVAKAALSRSSFTGSHFSELFVSDAERKLVQILRDTKARRGVDMKIVRQTQTQTEIEFKLWDLFSKTEISSFRKNFSRQKLERLKSGWLRQTLGKSIRLIPNSLTVMASVQALTAKADYPVTEQAVRRKGIINLLSVTSVPHPDQFNEWDAGFEAGPSLVFNSFDSIMKPDLTMQDAVNFVKENPDAGGDSLFTGYALAVPFDAAGALHTPAGAFRGFLGTGLGLFLPTASQAPNRNLKVFPLIHVGADWIAYSSQRIFFQSGVHIYTPAFGVDSIERRKYLSFDSWASFSVGFGYYFPDTQGYLESLLVQRQ
jgi:hypothetical protein